MTSSQPPRPPPAHSTCGPPAGGGQGGSFDTGRLTVADQAIAGLTVLLLVLSFFTWYDFGDDFFGVDISVSGWTDGQTYGQPGPRSGHERGQCRRCGCQRPATRRACVQ